MMKSALLLLLFVVIPLVSCNKKEKTDIFQGIIQYEDFKRIVEKNDNVLYLVNFWATWCGPCVEEIPDFMAVNDLLSNRKDFKMILVSLDDSRHIETELRPFMEKHKITADVYLLDDVKRMNYWMPAVDPTWTGSIPATVLYKNGEKLSFHEKILHKEELLQIINQYIAL